MGRAADQSYVKELLLALGAYVIVLVASIALLNGSHGSAWWRIPVALAPVIPAIFGMHAVVRSLRRMDEPHRRAQLEALAFGFAGTAVLTLCYGFLERVGFPHLNWTLVWPLMGALWALGLVVYRE